MTHFSLQAQPIIEQELIPYCHSNNHDIELRWDINYGIYKVMCISQTHFDFDMKKFLNEKNIFIKYSENDILNLFMTLSNDSLFYHYVLKDESTLLNALYEHPLLLEKYVVNQSWFPNYINQFLDTSQISEQQQQSLIQKIVKTDAFKKIEVKSFLKDSIEKKFLNPSQYAHYFNIELNQEAKAMVEKKDTLHLIFNIDKLYLVNLDKKYKKQELKDITVKALKQIQKVQSHLDIEHSIITEDEKEIGLVLVGQQNTLNEKFLTLLINSHLNSILQFDNVSTKILNKKMKELTFEFIEKMKLETMVSTYEEVKEKETQRMLKIEEKKIAELNVVNSPKRESLNTYDAIKSWLEIKGIENYTILPNLTVDVHQSVNLHGQCKHFIPIQFGTVEGDFDCSNNELLSLEGSPFNVLGKFFCGYNLLRNFEYLPIHIRSHLYCSGNPKLVKFPHHEVKVHSIYFDDTSPFLVKEAKKLRPLLVSNKEGIYTVVFNSIKDKLQIVKEHNQLNKVIEQQNTKKNKQKI